MSLLTQQNSTYYPKTFGDILTMFEDVAVTHLTQQNKKIAMGVILVTLLVYYICDRVLKPPDNLRHLPYRGYLHFAYSFFIDHDSFFDRASKYAIPYLNKSGNSELCCEIGAFGWEVHISNYDDAKRILLKHEIYPKMNLNLGHETMLFNRFAGGPNMFFVSGNEWKAQRKIISPAFRRSMPVKLFGNLGKDLFKVMDSMDDTIEVNKLLLRWTLDAIGKAAFGFDFQATTDLNSKWVKVYKEIGEGIRDPLFIILPSLDEKFLWMFPKRQELHRKMDTFLAMLDEVIERKRKIVDEGVVTNENFEENERDLLTLMIESEKRGESIITNTELRSNLCLFFFAGHDTTSNALSFTLYHLAKHPEYQQRAREEAIAVLGDEPEDVVPTLEDTKQMTYIKQVIKESLRLSSPATAVVPRMCTEDSIFSGQFVPKGTVLAVQMYNIHHREKYWKDADTFNPDRFADDGVASNREVVGGNLAWLPFSNGARQCVGINFSLMEQRVILSLLLRKFTWTLPEDSAHWGGLKTGGFPIVCPLDLKLKFKKRY